MTRTRPTAGPASAAHLLLGLAAAPGRRLAVEWSATPFHGIGLSMGRPRGAAAKVRDFRPPDLTEGQRIMAGAWRFAGERLDVGASADPWNRASPSRRFAAWQHGFTWLGGLLACDRAGAAEALRLVLGWRRVFGRWNAFAWDGEVLRRRVVSLAAALPDLAGIASDAEGAALMGDLSRQARQLMAVRGDPAHAAERALAAAIGACALAGPGPAKLREQALRTLERRLPEVVLADGGHASRSPEAALELLFDLLALDEALTQLGRPPPTELSRAIDRLTGAVRFFTLADGRLASAQGGADAPHARIMAAVAHDEDGRAVPGLMRESGYQRLEGGALQVFVDAGEPANGRWSVAACAQPAAIEVVAAGRRLITGAGWSPDFGPDTAARLSAAAAAVTLDEASPGTPLEGFAAWSLGTQLAQADWRVTPRRSEGEGVILLEISHDAWLEHLGVRAERRLYVDGAAGELRGEDRFMPTKTLKGDRRRFVPYAIRFPLHPEARASIAMDGKGVLIRHGHEEGWWLRTDAAEINLAPAMRWTDGEPRATEHIVLSGLFRLEAGGRVRWKLGRT